jgi:hypothetical protein
MAGADGGESRLSFSDQLILQELRAGRRDPEIAVKLGVTVGHVRARIEGLMRTASVASREGLAGWDPDAPTATLAPATGAAAAERSARPRLPWVRALAAAAAALAAAGAVAFYLAQPAGESTSRAGPPAAQSPVPATGPPVERLRAQPASDFPADLLLYVIRWCEGCATPTALDRIYRDQFGRLRSEVLVRPVTATGKYMLSVWAARDASDLVVAVCDRGGCGGRAALSEEAMTRFYRSRDGGASWIDMGAIAGAGEIVAGSTGELLLVRAPRGDSYEYAVLGGDGSEVAADLLPPGPPAEFALISKMTPEAVQGLSRIATNANGVFAYTWYPQAPTPDEFGVSTRLGIADRFGNTGLVLEYVGSPLLLGAWLDARTVTATITLQLWPPSLSPSGSSSHMHLPVLIDIARRTVTSLVEPFTNERYRTATNLVAAAVRGPFLRIGSHGGTCLPIYAAPRYDAREVSCLAEGTLVTSVETRVVGSEEWQAVRPPSGRTGWLRPADSDVFSHD